MTVELINPEELHAPTSYSHVAVGRGSRLIFVAGQVGYDREGTLVAEGDVAAQAEQAYRNVASALAAAARASRTSRS